MKLILETNDVQLLNDFVRIVLKRIELQKPAQGKQASLFYSVSVENKDLCPSVSCHSQDEPLRDNTKRWNQSTQTSSRKNNSSIYGWERMLDSESHLREYEYLLDML